MSNLLTKLKQEILHVKQDIRSIFYMGGVVIQVNSPFFSPTANVYRIKKWDGKIKYKEDSFKVPFTEDYRVDLDYIGNKIGTFNKLQVIVSYPPDWEERINKIKEEE